MIRALPFLIAFAICLLAYAALDLAGRALRGLRDQFSGNCQPQQLRRSVQGVCIHIQGNAR